MIRNGEIEMKLLYEWKLKPYDWMIKYAPHRDWIEGRGLLIALGLSLGGIGSGLYLTSLFFGSLWGMLIGWLITLVMGGLYLLHLDKPLRFWRMFRKPQTSWMALGFIFINLFIVFGTIQLAISYWLPGAAGEVVFKILAGLMAFGQLIYTGFVLSYCKSVPFWNSAALPLLFATSGLLGGLTILLAISLGSYAQVMALEIVILMFMVFYALIIALYFGSAIYTGPTARESVMKLIRGSDSLVFWIGEVLIGLVVPAVILLVSYLTREASTPLLITVVICIIVGGLALRFGVLKAALYTPLLPVSNF